LRQAGYHLPIRDPDMERDQLVNFIFNESICRLEAGLDLLFRHIATKTDQDFIRNKIAADGGGRE
jgi:hypothetical protein